MYGKCFTNWWFYQSYSCITKEYRVGGFNPSEKYESQLGWSFPIYGKITNVPNHQPGMVNAKVTCPFLECGELQVCLLFFFFAPICHRSSDFSKHGWTQLVRCNISQAFKIRSLKSTGFHMALGPRFEVKGKRRWSECFCIMLLRILPKEPCRYDLVSTHDSDDKRIQCRKYDRKYSTPTLH